MNARLLDSLPIWLVFLLTVMLIVLSVEIGYRVAVNRARKSEKEREAPIDSMVGPTLGLLAFMLAFTSKRDPNRRPAGATHRGT